MTRTKASDNKVEVRNIRDVSGEVNIAGRDIVKNIKTIYQRVLTAAEEADRARKLESKLLAEGIAMLVQNLSSQASEGTDSDSPYKGLLPYNLNEAEIFYGRTEAKKDLINHIKQSSLTVLHAESGAGKSSLLQAGIAGQLIANGHLAIYLRPHHAAPVDFIKRMFLPELTQAPALAEASLREFLRQVCGVLGPKVKLYLLVDQFEEFFHLKKEERLTFLESLADCIHDPSLKVRWVLALRKEALSDLAELESFGITQFKNTNRLNRLSRAEAQEAIIEPAKRHGIAFEQALVDYILDTLAGNDEVQPTHLQLICSALTDDLPENKTLTLANFIENEGGTDGILRDYLKRQLEDLPAEEQVLAWKVLRAMITADRQRAVRPTDELIQELKISGASKEQIESILRRLLERRLLLIQVQTAVGETYELAHDYLVNEVELDPQEQARKAAQELLDQESRTYHRHKTLLTAERLAVIEPYRYELRFSTEADELLRKSREAVQQEQRARERSRTIFLGSSFAVAVLMSLLAVWGFRSSDEASKQAATAQAASTQAVAQQIIAETNAEEAKNQEQIAHANEHAALALANSQTKLANSILLSLAAFGEHDNYQTRGSILENLRASPHLRQFLFAHTSEVFSVAFSPDGKTLASGGCGEFDEGGDCIEGEIILWDVESGQPIHKLLGEHTDYVFSVAFKPDSNILASGSTDGRVILWDMESQKPIGQLRESNNSTVYTVAFNHDGSILASAGSNNVIYLWDVANRKLIDQLKGHSDQIYKLTFSADGNTLASSGQDKYIILWNVQSRQIIGQPLQGHTDYVWGLAFSPDGNILASGSNDRTIMLWSVLDQKPIGDPLIGHTDTVFSVAFSPDGKTLISGSWDKSLILWDLTLDKPQPIGLPFYGHTDAVDSVAFSPNGKTLASGGYDKAVALWDISSPLSFGQELPYEESQSFPAVDFNADGLLLATGGMTGNIKLWDVTNDKPELIGQPLQGHKEEILDLAFSSDGKWLASISEDNTIILWNMDDQPPTGQTLIGQYHTVVGLAFSLDDKILASGGCGKINDQGNCIRGDINLWDIASGKPIGQTLALHTDVVYSVAFSPDGKTLVSGSWDKTIILWDVTTDIPQPIGSPLRGHADYVTRVAFSPDGRFLASGSRDSMIILWDVITGQRIGPLLQGHKNSITDLTFSPTENTLASSSTDGTVILWDTETMQMIGELLRGPGNSVWSIDFSPDGKTLVSGSVDGPAILWDVDVASWIQKACRRVGRNFTHAEWVQYFPNEEYKKICDQWPLELENTATGP